MSTVYDLSFDQLAERLASWGEPSFRARQVWTQLWKRGATYEEMSDVSPALRERLTGALPIGVELLDERTADRGATRKALLRLGGTRSTVGFDLYNLFNANPGTAFNQMFSAGSTTYLRPTTILRPRFVRFNVTVDF